MAFSRKTHEMKDSLDRILCAAFLLTVSVIVHASMAIVTLPELIKKSEVIVYGHVIGPQSTSAAGSSTATFEVLSVLKGKPLISEQQILLCNSHQNSEWPDLSRIAGNKVIFVKRTDSCFQLSHGYKSVVSETAGRVATVAIKDEPHDQPLDAFLKKIESLVSGQARQMH
jgi:hypothetical protein